MITKQLFTYTQKVERANEIISLRKERIKKSEDAIKIIDGMLIGSEEWLSPAAILQGLELEIKRIDFKESIMENSIQLRILEEVLKEDMTAKARFEKIKNDLDAEISEGKWDECIETIKETALAIRRKNKNADTSRLTNAVGKSFEDFESDDERLDHFKLLKDLATIKA
jgi:hypothetical protein